MAGPIKPISSSAQIDLGLESEPEQLQRKKPADPGYKEVHEKYNPPDKGSKAAENEEFKDKRQPKSELIAKSEIERMKEILNKPRGGGGGGSGGAGGLKSMKYEPVKYAKGGSASSRADGCAIRGKTRGTIKMCGGGKY